MIFPIITPIKLAIIKITILVISSATAAVSIDSVDRFPSFWAMYNSEMNVISAIIK